MKFLGYLYYHEKDSPVYPLDKHDSAKYSGGYSSKVGYSASITLGYLLCDHVAASLNGSFDKSSDYTEWNVGIRITFLLRPRRLLHAFDIDRPAGRLFPASP